jgi:hypothetical protein
MRDPGLLATGLRAIADSSGKNRVVELDRCPKCNHPIGHYRDDRAWQQGKYWHLTPPGGWPCNKVDDF